jgi:hypothetical protein
MQSPKNTHNQASNTISFDTVNEIKYTYLGLTLILLPFFCGMTMKNTASQVSEIQTASMACGEGKLGC